MSSHQQEEDKDGPARTPEEEYCSHALRKSLHQSTNGRSGEMISAKQKKVSHQTRQRWLEAGGIKGALVMCLQQSGNNSHQGLRLKLLSLRQFVTFFFFFPSPNTEWLQKCQNLSWTYELRHFTCITEKIKIKRKGQLSFTFGLWQISSGSQRRLGGKQIAIVEHYQSRSGSQGFSRRFHVLTRSRSATLARAFAYAGAR